MKNDIMFYFSVYFYTNMQHTSANIVGIMSGTSLDGLDIALCRFSTNDKNHHFELLAAETINYDYDWKTRLESIFEANAEDYFKLNQAYGKFIGDNINYFLIKHQLKADYIASHGHTVFHRPELGFTTQIGCGATIAAITGVSTICDFRSLDVALSGQGAPLVPIGDRNLFYQYESCLNIGGIANISFTKNKTTYAFDICVANMALNYLAEQKGKKYDENGYLASNGNLNHALLNQLLSLDSHNKSLGREWFETYFSPILKAYSISTEDKLATCVEFCAQKVANCLNMNEIKSVMISGGGAYNFFLIERLRANFNGLIEIPKDSIIQFKEAIIFAYLGFLRVNNLPNSLSSVTNAKRDSSGGCIYLA